MDPALLLDRARRYRELARDIVHEEIREEILKFAAELDQQANTARRRELVLKVLAGRRSQETDDRPNPL
jgi:hypothetical protein